MKAEIKNGEIKRYISETAQEDITEWRIVDIEEGAKPSFNPATEKLVKSQSISDKVYITWSKVDLTAEEIETNRVKAIKAEAQLRILEVAQDWRQRNIAMRIPVLQAKENRTQAEQDELDDCIAKSNLIKAIRDHSNALEADPDLEENWPEVAW